MTDPLTDPDEGDEYAVDAVPSGDHVGTVLADGFREAARTALDGRDDPPTSEVGLYDVTHMATGERRRVEPPAD